MDESRYIRYNERAWDREVDRKSIWTDGLTEEELQKALSGTVEDPTTTYKPMPSAWHWDLAANGCSQSVPAAVNKRSCSLWPAARSRFSISPANSSSRTERWPIDWV